MTMKVTMWRSGEHEVLPGVVGASASMRRVAGLVRRCAQRRLPTLIRGETGTGKELVARALHDLGPRRDGPFVAVNAATLSDELGAGALFGHVRGAYTGAEGPRQGALRRANGGTLFIDEVAALSPRMQALLLRTLEERVVCPVGGDEAIPVDLRLISATCEPIEQRVAEGRFRPDLFQRLSTLVVRLPPVRERDGDLPLLIERLLTDDELVGYRVGEGALELLVAEPLPGNVRELRNLLVQATLVNDDGVIDQAAVAQVLRDRQEARGQGRLSPSRAAELVAAEEGNVSAAARRAGMPRTTFRDLLRRRRPRAESKCSPVEVLVETLHPATLRPETLLHETLGQDTLRPETQRVEGPPTLRSAQ